PSAPGHGADGCVYTNDNTNSCDDGFSCTDNACVSGTCVATPVNSRCNDNNACTDDACNPSAPGHGADGCVYTNDNTNTCSDAFTCTDKACVSGTCVATPVNSRCNDNNVCADDACNPSAPGHGADGCVYTNDNTNTCSDGNSCTDDQCINGVCVPGANHCVTQITPTATTCDQYRTGTAPDLNQLNYIVKGAAINNVSPGVFFYYTRIVAPSSSFTITVTQSNAPTAGSCSSWRPIDWQNAANANLYSATCGSRSSSNSFDPVTGTVTMSVTGATAGETLIVGIKYSPGSLKGQSVCRPHPTEMYSFSDSGGGGDSIVVVPKN